MRRGGQADGVQDSRARRGRAHGETRAGARVVWRCGPAGAKPRTDGGANAKGEAARSRREGKFHPFPSERCKRQPRSRLTNSSVPLLRKPQVSVALSASLCQWPIEAGSAARTASTTRFHAHN
eukprot:352469-Chlamydomonas_euryale.AAC.3